MLNLKKYLNQKPVRIALIAALIQILLILFLNNNFVALGTADFILTILLFGFVLGTVAYFIGKGTLTLFKLFLIGFFGVIVYNQGAPILNLIDPVPFTDTLSIAVTMGLLTLITGRLKGVKK